MDGAGEVSLTPGHTVTQHAALVSCCYSTSTASQRSLHTAAGVLASFRGQTHERDYSTEQPIERDLLHTRVI